MESTSEFDMGIHEGMHRCGGALHRSGILDALIGCQGRVVYTEEDVEAAAKTIVARQSRQTAVMWWMLTDDEKREVINTARETLTTAGGVVADEVVECGNGEAMAVHAGDGERSVMDTPCVALLRPGDILYIVRAKEE